MMKYLRLYKAFFKASLVADMEYRANFLTRIVTDIFWYLAQIITFEALFTHTELIGTWNVLQMRVFLGVLFVVDAFYMIMFSENLDKFSDKVRKGEMDLLLAKPVDSQFILSCQRVNTAIFGNLLMGVGWLIFALRGLPDFDALRLLWLLILIPAGLTALYSVRFMFGATAVIFTKSENLQYIWYQVYKLGMRPDHIYFPWLKYVLLTLFPVALVASVPSRAILESPNYGMFLWVVIWSAVLLWLSHKFWHFCLKFYSSASS